jgi:hypothetical protein
MGDAAADGLAERVVAFGRRGMGRAEIAAALGLGEAELAGMAEADAGLEAALARAGAAERAWWEAAPREALAAGVRFNLAGWLGAMRWRFGEEVALAAAQKPIVLVEPAIFDIPDNGRQRRPRATR